MTRPRTIGVVTGTRADYGLLQWHMRAIVEDPDLELVVFATGAHLSPEFGLTYRQIEADGFSIDARVEMLVSSDTGVGVAKSVGLGTIGFAEALARRPLDMLVVLGDRFEILAAAQAAMLLGIPLAHIHGGETTAGAYDDSIRHAITKLSQYHFVAAEPYRRRVIQLGEAPERVFTVGAPGLDQLDHLEWLSRSELEQFLNLPLDRTTFLVTYHATTRGRSSPGAAMVELLAALDAFPDSSVVFTHPNADVGGRAVVERIDQWVADNSHRARSIVSLGQQRYLSLMREADVIIGNSSSGITEAPALMKATVNIGDRQDGRLKASSVIDTADDGEAIISGISTALSSEFRDRLGATVSLYGTGGAGAQIKDLLKRLPLDTRKVFFDVEYSA